MFGITIPIDLLDVTLLNEAQKGNGGCFIVQRNKIDLLEVAAKKGPIFFLDVINQLEVERTKHFGCCHLGNLVEYSCGDFD